MHVSLLPFNCCFGIKVKKTHTICHTFTLTGEFSQLRRCVLDPTADSPLCRSSDTSSMSLARQRKTFLPPTYSNLSYHDGRETLLLAFDSPRAAALLQEWGRREEVSSTLFSSASDEDEESALVKSPRRRATSMLNLPCPGLMFQWRRCISGPVGGSVITMQACWGPFPASDH